MPANHEGLANASVQLFLGDDVRAVPVGALPAFGRLAEASSRFEALYNWTGLAGYRAFARFLEGRQVAPLGRVEVWSR